MLLFFILFVCSGSSSLNTNPFSCFRNNFARIFACTYPLYHTEKQDLANEICGQFLAQFISDDLVQQMISQNFDDIVIELLNRIIFQAETDPPNYSPDTIRKLFSLIAGTWQMDVSLLLYESR